MDHRIRTSKVAAEIVAGDVNLAPFDAKGSLGGSTPSQANNVSYGFVVAQRTDHACAHIAAGSYDYDPHRLTVA
jgi:hypothetical protein